MKYLVVVLTLAFSGLFAGQAYAGKKNLIDYRKGKAKPQLAKSWTKVKDGEYEFTLDTNKEIASGVKVSPAVVKTAVEKKLKKKCAAAVTPNGTDKVTVAYTCDEETFLKKIAKVRIKAGGGDELAMDSSVSEGGIRANKFVRGPNAGEVKAQVVKIDKNWVRAVVNSSKSPKIKGGAFKISFDGKKVEVGNSVVFTPGKQEKGIWKLAKGKEVIIGK